jgi:hypothetical protein
VALPEFGILSGAKYFAECFFQTLVKEEVLCRVPGKKASVKEITRQRSLPSFIFDNRQRVSLSSAFFNTQQRASLPSVKYITLGKKLLCRVFFSTLGKDNLKSHFKVVN